MIHQKINCTLSGYHKTNPIYIGWIQKNVIKQREAAYLVKVNRHIFL